MNCLLKKGFNLLLCFLGISLSTMASELPFINYTALDGLSSSEVYDIAQDNQGYIWFATDRGLTRYDGVDFKRYTIADGLPDNVIYNFFEQDDGTIWCTTSKHQLFYFKNAAEGFTEYAFNHIIKENLYPHELLNDIFVSPNGEVYIVDNSLIGYFKIDASGKVAKNLKSKKIPLSFTGTRFKAKTLREIPDLVFLGYSGSAPTSDMGIEWPFSEKRVNLFSRMLVFPEYRLQFAFLGNSYYKIKNKSIITKQHYTNEGKRVLMAGKFDEKTFWIAYQYGGVQLFDLKGNMLGHFLKENSVTKIHKDHEGGLWISTLNQGVFYCSQPLINRYRFENSPLELTKNKNNQIVVTLNKGDILQQNIEKDTFSSIFVSEDRISEYLQYDSLNNILYYGSNKKNAFIDKNNNDYNQVNRLSDDEKHSAPFNRIGFYLLKKDGTYHFRRMPHNLYDITNSGNAFFLGTEKGLYRYDADQHLSPVDTNPYFSYRIADLDYRERALYIATMGSGLVVKASDTIFAITKKDGLLSNICTEVFVEDKHTIWVGTNQGLSKVSLHENRAYDIKNMSAKQGMLFSEISDIEITDKKLWVAAKEGLFSMPKELIDSINTPKKKWLTLNHVLVNNKLVVPGAKKQFSYRENALDFRFKAVSFRQGKNMVYRYKIHQKDSVWQYTKNKSIRFTDLIPQNYEFLIQVQTENGSWTKSIRYPFKILPPLWRTWWFILLSIFSISFFTYLIFKYRLLIFDRRLANRIGQEVLTKLRMSNEKPVYVDIKEDRKIKQLATSEIGYFRSSGNYTQICTTTKKHMVRMTLTEFYNALPDTMEYIRLHRSFYVRIDKVVEKGKNQVTVLGETIPVSKTYLKNMNKIIVY